MHNLFGRVAEIHVFADDDDPEDFYIEEYIPGETIAKVLSRVQYEPSDLFRRVKNELDQRIKDGTIRPKDGVSLADFYETVMKGTTYLQEK
jgi:arginine decarboxylase